MLVVRKGLGDESGQAVLLWIVAVVMAMLGIVVIAANRIDDRRLAQAETVADLTALAAVTGGESAAGAIAEENGAELVSLSFQGDGVRVEVEIDGVAAHAMAVVET